MKFKPAENKIVVQYLDESEDDELPQPQPNAYSRNQTARSKAVYAEVLGVSPPEPTARPNPFFPGLIRALSIR